MKINSISLDYANYKKINQSNSNKKPTFQGYVNGKFYRDEIINEAKKALKNQNWKEKLLARKISLGESLKTWHKREGSNDIAGRVLMGIFTLGLTEITWGLAHAAMDASENKEIDKMIEEIEQCIEDLGEETNQE